MQSYNKFNSSNYSENIFSEIMRNEVKIFPEIMVNGEPYYLVKIHNKGKAKKIPKKQIPKILEAIEIGDNVDAKKCDFLYLSKNQIENRNNCVRQTTKRVRETTEWIETSVEQSPSFSPAISMLTSTEKSPQFSLPPISTLTSAEQSPRFSLPPISTLTSAEQSPRFSLPPITTLNSSEESPQFSLPPISMLPLPEKSLPLSLPPIAMPKQHPLLPSNTIVIPKKKKRKKKKDEVRTEKNYEKLIGTEKVYPFPFSLWNFTNPVQSSEESTSHNTGEKKPFSPSS